MYNLWEKWITIFYLPKKHIWYSIRISMSMTYNPKRKKRARTHGFLARTATPTGRAILKRRRQKGRVRLTLVKSR